MMCWASASISAALVRSPALMAARQAMECSTHSVFSRSIAAAVRQLCGQLHKHILDIVHRHIGGHGTDNHGRTAKILGLNARIGQQIEILQHSLLFCSGQVDLHRHKQHLRRHIAVVPGKLLKQNTLVRGVLVDQAKLAAAFRNDVGLEHLADKTQRLALGRRHQCCLLRDSGIRQGTQARGPFSAFSASSGSDGCAGAAVGIAAVSAGVSSGMSGSTSSTVSSVKAV